MDASRTTTWQRLCSVIRRLLRAFESEHTDNEATWKITLRVCEDTLDGGWVAECVSLPGCFAQGETKEEALYNLSDAITSIISLRMEQQFSADADEMSGDQELTVAVAS